MPRAKQAAKRTWNEEVVHMEPLSDHPLFQYFSRLDDLNNYIFNFSERIVISPRYLDIQLLESQNFNQLSTILHDQGLIDFVQLKNIWYPELIRICYSTLSINFNEEHPTEFTMKFRLNKVDYELDSHRLESIWNLDRVNTNDACLFDEEGEEQQPPPPPQEQAPQEQAGPSEQPSMRDMMQVLLRIEQNQANMDIHLTRVDQRLSRIEQYLEIDEYEDQD
ncbi:hypothetical protein PIB30_081138 [Stylosanthes scabra]|uniref:Uncharacterized protein n=1 Tax=Stylosanthes scabra TaxID=79078 RepID=A0ABU6ZQ77_9FABA|nr:hypothetical protein [Stylosanthes scabra]